MKNFNPADNIQDLQYFGEVWWCKPIDLWFIYTFLSAKTMFDTFEGNMAVIVFASLLIVIYILTKH
jgi:methionine-gamma-lyase